MKAKKPWRKNSSKPNFKHALRPTPLKKISKSRRQAKRKYFDKHSDFLSQNPVCMICLVRCRKPNPSTEIHHARGRIGRLLNDERFFVASCRECREWPHEHPREAREMGVLAEATDWNVFPG